MNIEGALAVKGKITSSLPIGGGVLGSMLSGGLGALVGTLVTLGVLSASGGPLRAFSAPATSSRRLGCADAGAEGRRERRHDVRRQSGVLLSRPARGRRAGRGKPLHLWLGEWYLDLNEGTPYQTQVLGKYTEKTRDPVMRARILGSPGVTELKTYSSTTDGNTRTFSVSAEIVTAYTSLAPTGRVSATANLNTTVYQDR